MKPNDLSTDVLSKFQVLSMSNSNAAPYLKHFNKSGNWHLLKLLLKISERSMTVNETIRSSLSVTRALLILQCNEITLTQFSEYKTNKKAYGFNLEREGDGAMKEKGCF